METDKDVKRVEHQILLVDISVAGKLLTLVLLAENEVVIVGQQSGNSKVRLELRELDNELRMRNCEVSENRGNDGQCSSLKRCNPEPAGYCRSGSGQSRLRSLYSMKNPLGMVGQQFAFGREPHSSANGFDELCTNLRLE